MAGFHTSDEPSTPALHRATTPRLYWLRGSVRGRLCRLPAGPDPQCQFTGASTRRRTRAGNRRSAIADRDGGAATEAARAETECAKGAVRTADSDQAERDPQRAERASRLAADHDISIVWQRPCFEAVLLRHLEGRTGHRPPDTPGAIRALEREWAGYTKGTKRADLAQRIDHAAVMRAAVVEPDLAVLLRCIRLLQP